MPGRLRRSRAVQGTNWAPRQPSRRSGSQQLRKSQREGVPVQFEYQDTRATGSTWLSATVAIIGTGPTGRSQYSFIAEDITERKRSEAARRESEARLHAIANLVPDLLWSSDPAGRTDWYNQRWLEYSGQTPAQSLGDGWLEAIHPEDRETSILRFQAAAARGEPLRHEHRIRSAAGDYRWFLLQARPVHDEAGTIVRWFGAATDIDDLKHAEASLQRSHADLDRRVQERTAELQQLSQARQELLQRLVTVQEDERRRIARELHDSLGQFLSALNLRLSILEQTAGMASPVLEEIEQLRPAVQQIDRELDRLTMELRPPALDDFGLPAALRNYAGGVGAPGQHPRRSLRDWDSTRRRLPCPRPRLRGRGCRRRWRPASIASCRRRSPTSSSTRRPPP